MGDLSATSSSALMWAVSHYGDLIESDRPSAALQLDGIRELAEIADSYILNDTTYIGGLRQRDPAVVAEFFRSEVDAGSILLVTDDDINPFRTKLGILDADRRMWEDERANLRAYQEMDDREQAEEFRAAFRLDYESRFEEVNTREALAFLYFADQRSAAYIPERLFGFKAIARYREELPKLRWRNADFRMALQKRVGEWDHLPLTAHIAPSFLLEALRSAATPKGLFATLRQLRDSDAAVHYRKLTNVTLNGTVSLRERAEAAEELNHIFSGSTPSPRITRKLKATVALSSAAVAFFFPAIAAGAAAAPALVEAAEAIDEWLRRRTDIFHGYPKGSYDDLDVELRRVFGNIKFTSAQLAHFMETLTFDWSNANT
jgi:hypothetical protein